MKGITPNLLAKIICIELDGNIPSKKNSKQIFKRKNGTCFPSTSQKFKTWHEIAKYQVYQQRKQLDFNFPIEKCKSITAHLYYGTKHRKDNSNVIESVHDLLVDTGIIADDNWQVTGPTTQIPEYREKKPGAMVLIELPD